MIARAGRRSTAVSRVAALVPACAPTVAAPARASDRPIPATKLVLERAGATATLLFASKDPAFLFPAIGSADDPASGSPGGAIIELVSPAEPGGAAPGVPRGVGNPGWTVKPGATPSYRFQDRTAPDAVSTVGLCRVSGG